MEHENEADACCKAEQKANRLFILAVRFYIGRQGVPIRNPSRRAQNGEERNKKDTPKDKSFMANALFTAFN